MHIFVHFLISLIVGLFFGLTNGELVIFILGGTLIDADHLVYYILSLKTFSYKKIKEQMMKDYKSHNPHIYIFHSIELTLLLVLISIFTGNTFITLFTTGLILHLICDAATYIFIYKTDFKWAQYWCLSCKLRPGLS